MRTVQWVVPALALGVLVAACADDRRALTYPEYVFAYREAACKRLVRCGVAPTLDTCHALLAAPWVWSDAAAAIDAGKMTWDGQNAVGCTDFIEHASCDTTTRDFRLGCPAELAHGTLHEGEACAFAGECISNECWTGDVACEQACCIGTCIGDTEPALGHVGDRCRLSGCIDSFCENSICVPFRAEGEECLSSGECDYGFSCAGGGTGLACRALPSLGEPCTDRCRESGQVCALGTRICVEGGLGGTPCLRDTDCSPLYRCEVVNNQYACVERKALATGAPCSYADFCGPDKICGYATPELFRGGKCMAPKADGVFCVFDDECASGRCNSVGACSSEPCI